MYSSINKLVGETLKYVDSDDCDQIKLTTESGKEFIIYHSQDCCESVRILDTEGNWHDLIGRVIVSASHDEQSNPGKEEIGVDYYDSATLTTLTFKTDKNTVISRWIGESNGYYSESVDIKDITWPKQ